MYITARCIGRGGRQGAHSDLDFRRSRELNRSLGRPGEGQGGPNKGQLDLKLSNIYKAKNYINLEPLYIGVLIAILNL